MRQRMRSVVGIESAAVVAGLALLAMSSAAQGPGGGGFPPPPRQPPPQMMAKIQAWQKWRDSHKNVTALQQTLGNLQGLERDPQTRLNKKQAASILGVLNQWHSQPAITDPQARQILHQIKAPLSMAQIKILATPPAERRGFDGPPPGGFGGPPPPGRFGGPPPPSEGRFGGPPGGRGGPPPGGMRPGTFPSPKDYNPLNPSTLPFKRQIPRATQRLADLKAALSRSK